MYVSVSRTQEFDLHPSQYLNIYSFYVANCRYSWCQARLSYCVDLNTVNLLQKCWQAGGTLLENQADLFLNIYTVNVDDA